MNKSNSTNVGINEQLPQALRPKEAARRWSVSKATLYNLIRAGKIPSFTIGLPGKRCSRLIPLASLDGYFNAQAQSTGQQLQSEVASHGR